MPKTLTQLKRRLEEAMSEASEAEKIIPLLKQAIAQFDLKPADLFEQHQETAKRPPSDASKTRSAASRAKAMYQDADGNLWTGRGRRPTWLNEALKYGKTLEDFKLGGTRLRKAK